MKAELKFWNSVYSRRDQDREANKAFLQAKGKLEELHVILMVLRGSLYFLPSVFVPLEFQ
jgi:hypothetical protein